MTGPEKASSVKEGAVTPLDQAKKKKVTVIIGAIIASIASGYMANEAYLATSQEIHNAAFNAEKVQNIANEAEKYIEDIRSKLKNSVRAESVIAVLESGQVINTPEMKKILGTEFQDAIHLNYMAVDKIDYDADNEINFIAVTQSRAIAKSHDSLQIAVFKSRSTGQLLISMVEPVIKDNSIIGVLSLVQAADPLISHIETALSGNKNYQVVQNIAGTKVLINKKGNVENNDVKPIVSNIVSDKWMLEIWPQVNVTDHLPAYLKNISPYLALILLLGVGTVAGVRAIDKRAKRDMENYAEKLQKEAEEAVRAAEEQQRMYDEEKQRLTSEIKELTDSRSAKKGEDKDSQIIKRSGSPALNNIKHNLSMIIPSDMIKGSRIAESEIHNLTTQHAYIIGQALGSMTQEEGGNNIVIGHDGRSGCDKMSNSLMSGITDSGIDVINLTDTNMSLIWSAIKAHNAKAGIMIGSDNDDITRMDIRIAVGNRMANYKDLKKINDTIMRREFTTGQGRIIKDNPTPQYIQDVASDIVIGKPLRVAIEASHNGVVTCVSELFRELGCEVLTIAGEISSNAQNQGIETSCLNSLAMNIRSNDADIGIAYDRDADRIRVLDNNGQLIPTNILGAILAKDILEQAPASPIVLDIESGLYLESEVRKQLGSVMYAKGHLDDICRACKNYDAPFGINTDCKINYNDHWHGEPDGIYASARIVEMLSLRDERMSDLVSEAMDNLVVMESRGILRLKNAQVIFTLLSENLGSVNRNHVEGNVIMIDFKGSMAWIKLINDAEISLRVEAWTDTQLEKGKDLLTNFIHTHKKEVKINMT